MLNTNLLLLFNFILYYNMRYNSVINDLSMNSVIDDINSNGVLDQLPQELFISSIKAITPPPPVPCFLKGTKILTIRGEILIEKLLKTDYLLNNLGKPIKILKISKFTREKHDTTHPYVIFKNTKINNFICNKDLYLSGEHAVLFNNVDFIAINKTKFTVKNNLNCNNYEYYHITSENYFTDVIIANGIPTESYGRNIINENNENLILYIFKKIKINNVRKLLSKTEFLKLIFNYNSIQQQYMKPIKNNGNNLFKLFK